MEFRGVLPQRKSWVKGLMLALCALMLCYAVLREQWLYVPILAVVALAVFFRKEHILSTAGVNIRSYLFGRPMDSLWPWDQVTTIHTDYRRAAPNVALHIGKDVNTRLIVVRPADKAGVLAMAAQCNPKIYIEDLTEQEREARRKGSR